MSHEIGAASRSSGVSRAGRKRTASSRFDNDASAQVDELSQSVQKEGPSLSVLGEAKSPEALEVRTPLPSVSAPEP